MLEIIDLCRDYYGKNKNNKIIKVEAVKNVSILFEENKSYCLVGESGSGKSTLAKLIVGIEKPTKGKIIFKNKDLFKMSKEELRMIRSDIQMVFQDSYSALNPRMTIYNCIAEPIRNFESLNGKEKIKKIEKLIKQVELKINMLDKLPNQLSGGQQKRVCIARAIAANPRFIVFDESVSGLDVTVRKKILDLILKLRKDTKSTYIFITHDIDVAFYMSDNIMVMKEGNIIEHISEMKSLNDFKHEYSKSLINSLPPRYPKRREYSGVI